MKTKELKSMNKEALDKKLIELRKELIKMNGQVSTGTNIKNPSQIKITKRTIAKILTQLNGKR